MQELFLEGGFMVIPAAADAATVSLAAEASPGLQVVITGYRGPVLPRRIHDPRLRPTGETTDPGAWRLSCPEGEFAFTARGVEHHQALPGLFDPLLAGFSLRARDRTVVRVLLRLLRLPGGAWLMRAWHASRG
jgi:hypothetical protein